MKKLDKNIDRVVKSLDKEDLETKKSKEIIEECLNFAIKCGYRITRGGVIFDWRKGESGLTPFGCNALGAVLLVMEKSNLAGLNGFDPSWINEVCKFLKVDIGWIVRFVNGFDYGNELGVIVQKDNGKDGGEPSEVVREKVSAYGAKLGRSIAKSMV
jgi:hypothetical protein